MKKAAKKDNLVKLLRTIPGVGWISTLPLASAVDDEGRFTNPGCWARYCGVVSSVRQSADTHHDGRITKEGRAEVRGVCVRAVHVVIRSKQKGAEPQRRWCERIRKHQGKKCAIIAVTRTDRVCSSLRKHGWKGRKSTLHFSFDSESLFIGRDYDGKKECNGSETVLQKAIHYCDQKD